MAESTSTERCDGWCGWCGAVFIDRPADGPPNCDECHKPLNENPPGGPVPARSTPPNEPFASALTDMVGGLGLAPGWVK
jgi:hypothetical protein